MTAPAQLDRTGCATLDAGNTPAQWVDILQSRNITVSERTLRERANRLRACHRIGRAMIITADQMETILKDSQPCPSSHTHADQDGGPAGVSNITARRSANTTGAALEHLHKQARKTGAPQKRSGGSVTSLSAKNAH